MYTKGGLKIISREKGRGMPDIEYQFGINFVNIRLVWYSPKNLEFETWGIIVWGGVSGHSISGWCGI